jgi:hypothetical protein
MNSEEGGRALGFSLVTRLIWERARMSVGFRRPREGSEIKRDAMAVG